MKLAITTSFIFLSMLTSYGQTLTGLWKVDEVLVGPRIVTPVAKWFNIKEDGTVLAGNGWTQNSLASWTYDEQSKYFLPVNKLKSPDPFGGFTVEFKDEQMIWKRTEEGDPVTVTLSYINELPMAPADSIQGIWELQVQSEGTEPPFTRLHVRPDRLYNYTLPTSEKAFGFWHMDAHASKFFLIHFDKSVPDLIYWVSFAGDELRMKSDTDASTLIFKRLLE